MPDIEKAIKEYGYSVHSLSEIRDDMQAQVGRAQLMLGSLAAISLFVAALNIMNTMNMAITERTKEIGVMKVIGCRLRDIRRSLLIEAGAIGLIGGIAGAALSLLISLVLNNLSTITQALGIGENIDLSAIFGSLGAAAGGGGGTALSIIPPWLIGGALIFATVVGLISGLAPANKAVKISSLEAIRHE
jgi:ABC-type antimicrobial peptide transport system permease subunit